MLAAAALRAATVDRAGSRSAMGVAALLLALPCLTGLVLTIRSVGVILGPFE